MRPKLCEVILLFFSLLMFVCLSLAQAPVKTRQPSAAKRATPDRPQEVPAVGFEKFVLPNGLQLIVHVDRKLPMAHINLWYHVGSKNERVGRSGFAHLFEHMMFEGSKNATGNYFKYAETAGANLFQAGVNGTTDWDRTNYFVTIPSANLERMLWVESDRLATLGEATTKERLDNQRDVVKNERRQGLENVPYGRFFSLLMLNLYPYRHPYANDVIGSHEDLTAASVDDVKDFFATYYTPNNLSLVVAGDVDVAETKRLVQKYFGGIPPGPALDRPPAYVPRLTAPKVIEVNDRVPQERTYIGWVAPAYFVPGDAEMDIASLILTDGLSSRLNKSLVYEKQLCTNVFSGSLGTELAGGFMVALTARPGKDLSEIEKAATAEISRLVKDGPTPAELSRAKTKWEFQFVTGLERIGGFGGKADLLNRYNTFLGNPDMVAADVARHRKITADGLRAAVADWLGTPNRVVVRFHPDKSERPGPTALDRSQQPSLGTDRHYTVPRIQSAALDNGLRVVVVERNDLPKVAILLSSKAGSVYDPPGKEGLANLAASVMTRGTRTRNALDIDGVLGDLGTSVSGGADREKSFLAAEVLKRNAGPALAVVADIARNPAFSADEVERERKKLLDNLSQESADPNGISNRLSPMLAFGREHPYGRAVSGLPSTVQSITRDDLARFHQTSWKPDGALLIFAGNITLEDAERLAKTHFGSWSGSTPAAPAIPQLTPLGERKIYVVDRPDAAQTLISLVMPGPRRNADDYYALELANAAWGGAFTARLGMSIREEKGYSYGVFSFLAPDINAGMWRAWGGMQTAKTADALAEFERQARLIAGEKPLTDDELAKARSNRVRGYAQEFESLSRVALQISNLWALGLPTDELQRQVDEYERLPLTKVNAAAAKYADQAHGSWLLVGDASKIAGGVQALKLGEIVYLDPEGKPVKK